MPGEIEPRGRQHSHHISTLAPSTGGILDRFRSMMRLATAQENGGTTLSDLHYLHLPVQHEQARLQKPRGVRYSTQDELSGSAPHARRLASNGAPSPTCYAVKSQRARHASPQTEPAPASGRRRSSTTSASTVALVPRHRNILYALDLAPAQPPVAPTPPHGVVTTLARVVQRCGRLSPAEADCYFAQLVAGLAYLHHTLRLGHRDVQLANLLLTPTGTLKIANFASSEDLLAAAPPPKKKKRPSGAEGETAGGAGGSGSGTAHYVAPEALLSRQSVDARAVDMWAAGVAYLEMRTGKRAWLLAAEGADEGYDRYLFERVSLWGFRPIENLKNEHCRRVMRSLLDPEPQKRMTASQVLRSSWFAAIELCDAACADSDGRYV